MDELYELAEKYKEYPLQAYLLIYQGIDWAREHGAPVGDRGCHLSGRELAQAIFMYSVDAYGPRLGKIVWEELNLKGSEDLGRIVFHLLESGLMQKEEEDKSEDFDGVLTIDDFDKVTVEYSFNEVEVQKKESQIETSPVFDSVFDDYKFKP